MIESANNKFIQRKGFFNQTYWSLRLPTQEITIDNLFFPSKYRVCLCSPYNENLDIKMRHKGIGGGEVFKEWLFDSMDNAFNFIASMIK